MSQNQDRRGLLKEALRALDEMQAKLHAAERENSRLRARVEPIAVLGIGCRFPGGVDGPDTFWNLLHTGADAITEVPPNRWTADRYFELDRTLAASRPNLYGGFLQDVDRFDANFFGIAPREALSMDPQHRLVLEVCWEALEHAGYAPRSLAGTPTGVFVGITSSDYWQHLRGADPQRLDVYIATGNSHNAAAGRVSFTLGLQGPAMAVDTACSSSLTAIHLACQSLRLGESNLALAGGVNTMHNPDSFFAFHKWGMMAGDGRCKTFDAAADGFVRAEGCGFIVLKRLCDAQADGDRVLAIIRGSAVNQDGATSGFTVPNGRAQEAVIRQALARSEVSPADVGYVEAHGTGTSLGDPIELEALDAVLNDGRPADRPLVVGSVKTNLGHLESAAGIASVIKVVLSMQHEEIPPHLHFKSLNPRVAIKKLPLVVPATARPWTSGDGRRRIAGVSSFGISGTNAHVVMEEAPESAAPQPSDLVRPVHLLTISAANDTALQTLAAKWEGHLAANPSLPLADVAHTACHGRTHLSHRAALVASTLDEARAELSALARGNGSPNAAVGISEGCDESPRIAFLFTGQGSQYAGMGQELYETQPTFRSAIDRCAAALGHELDVPLRSVLYPTSGEQSRIDETRYTQPALFAVEYALAELWRSWGVTPSLVLGHSIGEYVAACVAGVFTVDEALRLVAARGRLMQALPAGGGMAAVWASEESARSALETTSGRVALAAVNGPQSVVVAGPTADLAALCDRWAADGVRTQTLTVSHAFHSPLMAPMLDAFESVASTVRYARPRIGVISNLTGRRAAGDELITPAYWRRHAAEPVQFAAGMAALHAQDASVFLEVGPTPTLLGLGQACLPPGNGTWLPSLRKHRGAWRTMLGSLGALYVRGVDVQWTSFDADYPRRSKVALPTYPFQRERYWVTAKAVAGAAADDSYYALEWTRKALPSSNVQTTPPGRSTWAIFVDRGGVGETLARRFEAAGSRCVRVISGDGFHVRASDAVEIAATCSGDYARALEHAAARGVLAGIVHLWSLDVPYGVEPDDLSIARAQVTGAESLVRLVQAAVDRTGSKARLFTITRGVAPAALDAGAPIGAAPIWGVGRVAALEHPELWGALIDLDTRATPDDAALLFNELTAPDGEDHVSYREGMRQVARLVRNVPRAGTPPVLRTDGAYVITGGTGGIGVTLAEWMAERGARHIVLIGRRGVASLGDRGTRQIETLLQRGVDVQVVAGDVSDRARMTQIFEDLRAIRVRGVVHAAGVLRNDELRTMEIRSLRDVFRPKVQGAWILHDLTRDLSLDFFVLFSSGASVWGSRTLAHYGGANQFLDALCHYRRGRGLPAASINWGPWGEAGMASAEDQRVMAQMGIAPLRSDEGLRALERVLASGAAQLAVAKVDWRVFQPIYTAKSERRLLEALEPQETRAAEGGDGGSLALEVSAALAGERKDVLIAALQQHTAAVLGLEGTLPSPRQGLTDLGMDSLMAVELRNRLQHAAGRPLPPTLAFDAPTLELMAEFLLSLLGYAQSPEPKCEQEDTHVADVAPLSDEEVKAMLATELAALTLDAVEGEHS